MYAYLFVCTLQRSEEMKIEIKKSCDNFLIEVVSRLCFGQQIVPEDGLIQMLLDIIFTETKEGAGVSNVQTRELTLNKQNQDKLPVIRSFLLQLLLEHRLMQ